MTDICLTKHYRDACQYFTKFSRTLTISPPRMENTNENVHALYSKIHTVLDGFCLDYLLVPEFVADEELFPAHYRLHFHGVVKFKCRMQLDNFMSKAHMKALNKIGITKVDGIPHPRWIEYMFKGYEDTKSFMYEALIIQKSDKFVPLNIMLPYDQYDSNEE